MEEELDRWWKSEGDTVTVLLKVRKVYSKLWEACEKA